MGKLAMRQSIKLERIQNVIIEVMHVSRYTWQSNEAL